MKKITPNVSYKKTQKGAVLAFCLIFLVALTVLAVGGMETTIMEERMAGNMQDYNVAFQAAEVSLDTAEIWLAQQVLLPATSADGSEMVWTNAGLSTSAQTDWWNSRSKSWWDSNALSASGLSGVAAQPQYIIEHHFVGLQGESINIGTGDDPNERIYHRVTARGLGGNSNSQVMLQTTYVKPYD